MTLSEKIWYDFEIKKDALWKEDVKEFIKDLIYIAEENGWEVAVDENVDGGYRIVSGKEYIQYRAGEELTK